MAKTQYSLSDDPNVLGRPEGFTVTVKEIRISAGAGFIVALLGDIMTMPGLPKAPAALNIDIDEKGNITTLGRGGSDTTAVAIAAAIQAAHCYIFSDVDGVYTTDPNKVTVAKKLESLSYEEMLDISNEGAKVLHNRCVEIGERFHIPIVTKSTFNNQPGSTICDKVEDTEVKSIVKNNLKL